MCVSSQLLWHTYVANVDNKHLHYRVSHMKIIYVFAVIFNSIVAVCYVGIIGPHIMLIIMLAQFMEA